MKRAFPQLMATLRDLSPFYERKPGENYFTIETDRTKIEIHVFGVGDRMMVHQFSRAFHDYIARNGDPELGTVQFAVGGYAPMLDIPDDGTIVYWYYSHGPRADDPGTYLSFLRANMPDPDVVLCAAERFEEDAARFGFRTHRFPLGVYGYQPLGLDRTSMGYAGSVGHKEDEQVATVLGKFRHDPSFEWVADIRSIEALNLWYNGQWVTFGLTKASQRAWGTVNSRVFESLAAGTPLVLEAHPTVEDVLGFEYPYQVSSTSASERLVERIRGRKEEVLREFEEYSKRVRDDHSYLNRVRTFVEVLS